MSVRDTLLAALASYEGDDYERCQIQARGMTPAQMDEPWGPYGSFRQYMDKCRLHTERVKKAREFVMLLRNFTD